MRRKIYFFLERLEISRGERISVTILICCIIILSGIYHYREPVANFDPDHYEKLEQIFREKSRLSDEEKQTILARYQPSIGKENLISVPSLDEDMELQPKPLNEFGSEQEQLSAPEIVNINKASEEQLVTLPGIGPAYARRIIEWREENGLFTDKEQLLEIRGIGERRLEQMIPLIEL